jgi:hypothetical protein
MNPIQQYVPTCEAVNKNGQRCGFPDGHTYQHGNGPTLPPWDDPVVDSTPNLWQAELPEK